MSLRSCLGGFEVPNTSNTHFTQRTPLRTATTWCRAATRRAPAIYWASRRTRGVRRGVGGGVATPTCSHFVVTSQWMLGEVIVLAVEWVWRFFLIINVPVGIALGYFVCTSLSYLWFCVTLELLKPMFDLLMDSFIDQKPSDKWLLDQ